MTTPLIDNYYFGYSKQKIVTVTKVVQHAAFISIVTEIVIVFSTKYLVCVSKTIRKKFCTVSKNSEDNFVYLNKNLYLYVQLSLIIIWRKWGFQKHVRLVTELLMH